MLIRTRMSRATWIGAPWHIEIRYVAHALQMCAYKRVLSHTQVSRITREKVTSHANQSCRTGTGDVCNKRVMSHTQMSRITRECVISHVNESRHIWMSHVAQALEMCAYKRPSSKHLDASEWLFEDVPVLSKQVWMSHVSRTNESWATREWVMSRVWCECRWVMARVWVCHGIDMNESCHTYGARGCLRGRASVILKRYLIDESGVTHHGCIIGVSSRRCSMTHPYVTWRIHKWCDAFTCDTTHLCVWHDASTTSATKEQLIVGLFCEKWPMKIRHPMILRHPVLDCIYCICNSNKEPLIIGLFCEKWPTKIRHPMSLCHPVLDCIDCICDSTHPCQIWVGYD